MTLAAAAYPDGLVRRGTVAVLAATTGVLQLTVTVTAGGFGFKIVNQFERGVVFRWDGRCPASASRV